MLSRDVDDVMIAKSLLLDVLAYQGKGMGLPILIPLDKDPRRDRFLMDHLTDCGASKDYRGIGSFEWRDAVKAQCSNIFR